jgi:hypothetical protein
MKKLKQLRILTVFFLAIISLSLSGCGAMTTKQMAKIEQQYKDGKIDEIYYYEALDAYYNGDPKPPKTFIGKIWRSITNFFSNVIGFIFELIGLIIFILILRFIFGKK